MYSTVYIFYTCILSYFLLFMRSMVVSPRKKKTTPSNNIFKNHKFHRCHSPKSSMPPWVLPANCYSAERQAPKALLEPPLGQGLLQAWLEAWPSRRIGYISGTVLPPEMVIYQSKWCKNKVSPGHDFHLYSVDHSKVLVVYTQHAGWEIYVHQGKWSSSPTWKTQTKRGKPSV